MFYFTADAPATAITWSSSTVLPETRIAQITLPSSFIKLRQSFQLNLQLFNAIKPKTIWNKNIFCQTKKTVKKDSL